MGNAKPMRLVGEVVVTVGLMDRTVEQGSGGKQQRYGCRQVLQRGFQGVLRGEGEARVRPVRLRTKPVRRR
jgi:hypothetical protein